MPKWLSKKLIMTLAGAILVPVLQNMGVPQDTITWILGLIATYVAGQSVVDASKSFSLTDTSGK
jgi:cytochrome c oxidase assembly factor CtaG